MIKCHLGRLMGERKVRIADVARATGLHRNTLTLLYRESATRVDFEAIDKLCEYFKCQPQDLFQWQPNPTKRSTRVGQVSRRVQA